MGWSCDIICDKDILESDIDWVLNNMLDGLGEHFKPIGKNKQDWGWSASCDVNNPKENKTYISGSYSITKNIMEKFRCNFRNLLKQRGYKVKTRMNY